MEFLRKKFYRIAVDAMGGDFAPLNEVYGSILAANDKNRLVDFEIVFVGDEKKITEAIKNYNPKDLNYSIVHAEEVVTMHDDPTSVLKKKKNSSLYKGIKLLADNYVDAFVSAGNTGATLSTATILLGRIEGVSRPTIGSFFPTTRKFPTLLLDVGANIDVKPRYLYEFALMGSIYYKSIFGIENPKVGLLNIGEEETKGSELLLSTYKILKESSLNFIGNVEGRDVLLGTADVIVCDGLIGNIVLKFAESVLGLFKTKVKDYSRRSIINALKVLVLKPALRNMLKDMDYQQYGGVPLLGVNGIVIIGHGKSSPVAIKNMIYTAIEQARKEINKKIERALNPQIIENKQ
ncbi:phosphate acyltransferase PlsX [Bacteroidetes/Chlorobi group bacterium MS-B_bin-24]|jgi:glycerol-3-phosphate acyltransferase PlsX|nr:MAG: phosphate acyltransferase PlsX [Bacteroidetes/Chlorobi group bacterium MS-B_bin-24]